jgi:PGF-pre-PGF domain-containing protein
VLDIVKVVYPEAYDEEIRSQLDTDGLGGETVVRSEALADGRILLEARNLGRDRQVSFALPERSNRTVRLQRLNVSLASLNPTFSLTVRSLGPAETPAAPTGTTVLTRVELSSNGLPDEDVGRLQLQFSVNESALVDRDVAAENVTLYGYNGTAWRALDTRVVETANGSVVFRATATELSTFAVAVPETEAAQAVTATPTPVPTPTATAEPTVTTTETPVAGQPSSTAAPTTTSTQFPGFDVSVVVAAFLATSAALAFRRR